MEVKKLKHFLTRFFMLASICFSSVQPLTAAPYSSASGNPVSSKFFTCVATDTLSCYRRGETKPVWDNAAIKDARGLVISGESLFLTLHKEVIKINIQDGEVLQRLRHNAFLFDPVIYSNQLIVSDHQGGITALEIDDLAINWQRKVDEGWVYPPSLHHDTLFTGGQSGTLWALNLKDGELLWHILLDQELVYRPMIHRDSLIVSTFDGMVQNINPLDGKVIWKTKLKSPVINMQKGNPDHVIASGFDGKLYAVEIASGKVEWDNQAHTSARFNFLSGSDIVASVDHSGEFKTFDSNTGELIKTVKFEGHHQASPLLINSKIWLFPDEGPVIKISPDENY